MRLDAALREGAAQLQPKAGAAALREAKLLLAHVLRLDASRLLLEGERWVSTEERADFRALIEKRLAHQPIAQLIEERLFWGRRFRVTPDVLDPRPETETLVDAALQYCAMHSASGQPLSILDLGTGSGAILISVLLDCEHACGVGVDLSGAALHIAHQNAERHELGGRACFLQGSWFEPVKGVFDLVLANPPYISAQEFEELAPDVALWEPRMALTPEGDGLEPYRQIAAELTQHLAPDGAAFFEFGYRQGACIADIFRAAGFEGQILRDMNGHERVFHAKKPQF